MFLFGLSVSLSGQAGNRWTIGLGYHGNNLWNPGIHMSLDKPISWKPLGESVVKSWHFQLDAGSYWDPFSHLGMQAGMQLQHRRLYSGKLAFRSGIGGGYYRTFLPDTYELDENGTAKKVPFAGRNYAYLSFMLGTEVHNLSKPGRAWYFNLRADLAFPYNSYILPLMFIETGFRFRLKTRGT